MELWTKNTLVSELSSYGVLQLNKALEIIRFINFENSESKKN